MKSAAEIRIENKKKIYHFMIDGRQYTKQQVASGTDLSIATCNTLLNQLKLQGILESVEKTVTEVGRNSALYRIADGHESYLGISIWTEDKKRKIEMFVFSSIGHILDHSIECCDQAEYYRLHDLAGPILKKYPNIDQIIVGVPGVTEQGQIQYSDLPELNGLFLEKMLVGDFGIPVVIENDMHIKAFGYCKGKGLSDKIITMACFPRGYLPGIVTIHKGTVIRGANGIAGLIGYLSPKWEKNKDELSVISEIISAIICFYNPDTLALTGTMISRDRLEQVKRELLSYFPESVLPQFQITADFGQYYADGMFQLAVDHKKM